VQSRLGGGASFFGPMCSGAANIVSKTQIAATICNPPDAFPLRGLLGWPLSKGASSARPAVFDSRRIADDCLCESVIAIADHGGK
jgi:hypothetical protein